MKIAGLLILTIVFFSAVPKHENTSFMPQEYNTININTNKKADTTKSKAKKIITIKQIDEAGNEKEMVYEITGFNAFPDSLKDKLMHRFSFGEMPHHLDTVFEKLKVRLEKLNLPDSLFKNRFEKNFMMQFPFSSLSFEELSNRLQLLKENKKLMMFKKIEIKEIDDKELVVNNKGSKTLQLNQFAYYPNPNHGDLTIEFSTKQKKPISIKIYDLIGRVWYDETITTFNGNYRKVLPTKFSQGVFILRIEQDGKTISKKIVVE